MSTDTDVLIIGAGMSGLGLAVQLVRRYNLRTFEIIEKTDDVGGTWLVNTYPGCACDVPSHFYSYSFALNPEWSQVYSSRQEIYAYFRNVAERFVSSMYNASSTPREADGTSRYNIMPHVQFQTEVESARWIESEQLWEVRTRKSSTGESRLRRCRMLVSAVGSLSLPKPCEIPGAEDFRGFLFHSARWNHKFDYPGKKVVVLGNGCSATQFVPILAQSAQSMTQFARQPQYLAERVNTEYSPVFKSVMRYFPGAMRLYRGMIYAIMERDFAGFYTESGRDIRQELAEENEKYVKRKAPQKYWDALIPKYEIGCKRKVLDTGYLDCLNRPNVELINDDPVTRITESGVETKSGRGIDADAIILATGFQVARMLSPMQITGANGLDLNQYWKEYHGGNAQAYFGTCVPGFKNFFTLMGPNTVTGHQSVIYTVECQINLVLRLIEPIVKSGSLVNGSRRHRSITSVNLLSRAGLHNSDWMQKKLNKLVWSSGCTSWALDPETGVNIAMYPEYQFIFWLRTLFIRGEDFEYVQENGTEFRKKTLLVGGFKDAVRVVQVALATVALAASAVKFSQTRVWYDLKEPVQTVIQDLLKQGKNLLA